MPRVAHGERQISVDVVGQGETRLLTEPEQSSNSDGLRYRSLMKQRVRGDRHVSFYVSHSEATAPDNPVALDDRRGHAGQVQFVQCGLEELFEIAANLFSRISTLLPCRRKREHDTRNQGEYDDPSQ